MIRFALMVSMFFAFAGSASAVDSFTIAGCECYPQTVILGWRGTEPGTTLRVYRDNLPIYQGSNPTNPPNVYLYNQPIGDHGYKACTGIFVSGGFAPEACSQTLDVNVT